MKVPNYIGTLEDGRHLQLPKDAVTQGFAFMGKRGKGKSNLLGVFLEILLARGQSFVCLDPPAAHWGIRFAAGPDGRPSGPSGFDVLIIGGAHGDIPIEQTNGKEAAQIIVDGDISAVVDMKAMGFSERQKWCADFAEELFKINTTPRMIAFEEAHNFLPQQLKFDEQKRVSYAMGKLIEEGRGSGLGYVIASQKTQKVNKDQLTQVDNFFALGMIGPQDIDQVEGWFKHHIRDKEKLRDVMDDLPQMKAGECWALSPEWLGHLTKFRARLRVTYHAGRTPKPGERAVSVAKFSVTDAVKKLRERFAVKQSETRKQAQTLKEANATIRKLESDLKKKAVPFNPPAAVKTREITKILPDPKALALIGEAMKIIVKLNAIGFGDAEPTEEEIQRAMKSVVAEIRKLARMKLTVRLKELEDVKYDAQKLLKRMENLTAKEPVTVSVDVHKRPVPQPVAKERSAPLLPPVTTAGHYSRPEMDGSSDANIKGPHKKILVALAQLRAIGRKNPPKPMVAAWAGYSHGGGAFGNPLGSLNTWGYVTYPQPGTAELTDAGVALVGDVDPPADQQELNAMMFSILTGPERLILSTLMRHGLEAISKTQLAEECGKAEGGGAFGNPLGALRTAGFIDYPQKGTVQCAEWLFI